MKIRHGFVLLFPWLMMTLAVVARGEDFYEARLRSGKDAFKQKRVIEAIDQFRIAAFGFLESPPLLSESLARLALAESAAGMSTEVTATLSRFLDVERRFGSYGKAKLEPEIRAEFQTLLLQRVSPATLQSIPGLAGLVETEEQKVARLPPGARRKALEAGFRREPNNVAWPLGLAQEAAERQDDKEVLRWTASALKVAPMNPQALALQAHARVARREYAGAAADLGALPASEFDARPELRADRFVCLVEGGDRAGAEAALKDVPAEQLARPDVAKARQKLATERSQRGPAVAAAPQSKTFSASPSHPGTTPSAVPSPRAAEAPEHIQRAQKSSPNAAAALAESRRLIQELKASDAARILLQALRSEPDNRELRMALLEAYCLSGAWSRGAEQVALVAPFADGEVLPMFYAAVVLYQTGRLQEARGYMERAAPRVSGPLVDEYAKKILGQS
jgi:tetratricopeptide (TPR) repeat protein